MKILIVEDEVAMATGLRFNFEEEGYDVVVVGDGPTALEVFSESKENVPFDLVILDLMLPGMSGYETCREIRKIDTDVSVLVLSARTLSEDKAQAFDCGSDQYMTKPFALPELLSRVRNLLERRRPPRAAEGAENSAVTKLVEPVEFGNVRVDYSTFEVHVGDSVHSLTTMEMDLLRYFIEHEGVVLSRSQILEDVWDVRSQVTTRTIDNFVMRLRKILDTDANVPSHIASIRGTGYRFFRSPRA